MAATDLPYIVHSPHESDGIGPFRYRDEGDAKSRMKHLWDRCHAADSDGWNEYGALAEHFKSADGVRHLGPDDKPDAFWASRKHLGSGVMKTAARIERINHPMLDAGGVGECLNCGRVCTVEELLGGACPCGAATFTAIPRLTNEQKTVKAVVMDEEATLKDLLDDPNLITDANSMEGLKYPNLTTYPHSRHYVANPNPLTDQIHVAPLREGRKCQRAKRRARYNRPA